jgi:hypothetical protein
MEKIKFKKIIIPFYQLLYSKNYIQKINKNQ